MSSTLDLAKANSGQHIWLLSLFFPFFPLLGVGIALYLEQPYWNWLGVGMIYIALPFLDLILGPDKHGVLLRAEKSAKETRAYSVMVQMLLPVIYGVWAVGAWYITTTPITWPVWIAIALTFGWGLAFGINAGHEVGHKTDKRSKWIALLMLAPSFLGHFRIEHNQGHHSRVATPDDPATARFGESFWAFVPREYLGGWRRAWAIETRRAKNKGHSVFSFKNEVILATTLNLSVFSVMILVFGISVFPYLLLTALVSTLGLSVQNYIGHYGLLRQRKPNGKYEPCEPCHSWNCNQIVTNLISYNLALHSDHHANPRRHYPDLRPFPDAPQLPYGYMTMFMLAYFPPLFRRVMHPRLLNYVRGDMSRILTKEQS